MKRFLTVLASSAIALACVVMPVHAASEINADEQRLLDYIEKGVEIKGETLNYPKTSDEYNGIKEILADPNVDLSASEVDTIKQSVLNAKDFIVAHYNEQVTPELMSELIDLMNPAVDVFGMKLSYDAVSNELIILDANGNELQRVNIFEDNTVAPAPIEPGKKLENTGENFTSTYVIMIGLGVVLLGSGLLARKKNAESC